MPETQTAAKTCASCRWWCVGDGYWDAAARVYKGPCDHPRPLVRGDRTSGDAGCLLWQDPNTPDDPSVWDD